MLRLPPFEEPIGGLPQHFSEILAQRFAQVGVDLCGSYAGMRQQELDDADVHALQKHVRGDAVAE
jgi:hypothetical protein